MLIISSEVVLALLDQQKELEDAFLAELDIESDDRDLHDGDFMASNGYLDTGAARVAFQQWILA